MFRVSSDLGCIGRVGFRGIVGFIWFVGLIGFTGFIGPIGFGFIGLIDVYRVWGIGFGV